MEYTIDNQKQKQENLLNLQRMENGIGHARYCNINLIRKVKEMIQALQYQPELYPSDTGSIFLEYEQWDKSSLEFEVFPDKTKVVIIPKRIEHNETEVIITQNECEVICAIVNRFQHSAVQAAEYIRSIERT